MREVELDGQSVFLGTNLLLPIDDNITVLQYTDSRPGMPGPVSVMTRSRDQQGEIMVKKKDSKFLVGVLIALVAISAILFFVRGDHGIKVNRAYYANGQLEHEYFYNKDGELDGVSRNYYENGQVSLEETFAKGQFHGPRRSYYQNGQVEYETFYRNGVLDQRTVKAYYENGRLKLEAIYTDDKLDEKTVREYYADGSLKLETVYKGDPSSVSTVREYYKDGKLKSQAAFKDGKMEGAILEYNEDGTLKQQL